ncbi:MAG TPA: hypothetical protein VMH37_14160 [Candidatus Binataceae bacterium]|nr:hypothetical protein [Candidatus Binataceae bacterium]
MPSPNQNLLVIGYGSLLSGYGLLAVRRGGGSKLVAIDAEPAIVLNARRGLAKPSSHGNYLAMDLEPIDADSPITARAGLAESDGPGFGAVLLTFDRSQAPLISRREEYSPEAFMRLLDHADRAALPLGSFLLNIARDTGFNLLEYRRALRDLLGYTSPGYVFHPLPLEDGRVAIVAIGSGYEGSGDPAVTSARRKYGIDRLHDFGSALEITSLALDRPGQIGYFAECLLGAMHGLAMEDLMAGFEPDAPWAGDLARRVADVMRHEESHFLDATSMATENYRRRFGTRGRHPSLDALLRLAPVE